MRGPYEAPLLYCDIGDPILGDYTVFLARGYSLEQHQKVIGIDLSSSIQRVFRLPEGIDYGAKLDDSTLATIREDTGVNFVQCDQRPHPADVRAMGEL